MALTGDGSGSGPAALSLWGLGTSVAILAMLRAPRAGLNRLEDRQGRGIADKHHQQEYDRKVDEVCDHRSRLPAPGWLIDNLTLSLKKPLKMVWQATFPGCAASDGYYGGGDNIGGRFL